MFSAGVASSLFSSVTSALGSLKPAAPPASQPPTQSTGTTTANNPTGTSNPFQTLSADMQSWLTQNQADRDTQVHPHHHSGAGQQAPGQSATSSDTASPTAVATA